MAKQKTTSKKAPSGKKPSAGSSRAGAVGSTRKKKTTSKSAAKKTRASAAGAGSKKTKKKVGARTAAGRTSKKSSTRETKKKVITKKSTTKKPAAKKSAAKKSTTKKTAAKKPAAKKTAAKKPTVKKTAAKKAGTKKKSGKTGQGGAASRRRGRSVAEAASAIKADNQGYVFINGRRVRMISTKGQAVAKKTRPASPQVVDQQAEPVAAKPVKTHLSRKELAHYRELLLMKRLELCGDLNAMEDQALKSGGGHLSHMPIHMADIGTDTFDQDFMLGLAESERQRLREIDEALKRIEDRTYGVCQMTGNPIPDARLEAKPWAKYTIEAARELEGRWGA